MSKIQKEENEWKSKLPQVKHELRLNLRNFILHFSISYSLRYDLLHKSTSIIRAITFQIATST
jgi:hypothetical protein